jgi:hypothetical protein
MEVPIIMDELIRVFTERGDLAHLALFLWASVASAAALFALRELAGASRRFDEFVRQLALFNRRAVRRRVVDDDDRGDRSDRSDRD